MTEIQPLVSACYEPQETLDASPYFTLPTTSELHWMLEPDNARCCHIDHQTWGPLVVWNREANWGTESNYPKTKIPESTRTYSQLLLRRKNNMHHSMSELRLEPLQYAEIGNICAEWYYVCRQKNGRDLATFGINAVCILFSEALTLFTIYLSHSVGEEWGTIACSCNTSSGLELHFSFQPGQR